MGTPRGRLLAAAALLTFLLATTAPPGAAHGEETGEEFDPLVFHTTLYPQAGGALAEEPGDAGTIVVPSAGPQGETTAVVWTLDVPADATINGTVPVRLTVRAVEAALIKHPVSEQSFTVGWTVDGAAPVHTKAVSVPGNVAAPGDEFVVATTLDPPPPLAAGARLGLHIVSHAPQATDGRLVYLSGDPAHASVGPLVFELADLDGLALDFGGLKAALARDYGYHVPVGVQAADILVEHDAVSPPRVVFSPGERALLLVRSSEPHPDAETHAALSPEKRAANVHRFEALGITFDTYPDVIVELPLTAAPEPILISCVANCPDGPGVVAEVVFPPPENVTETPTPPAEADESPVPWWIAVSALTLAAWSARRRRS